LLRGIQNRKTKKNDSKFIVSLPEDLINKSKKYKTSFDLLQRFFSKVRSQKITNLLLLDLVEFHVWLDLLGEAGVLAEGGLLEGAESAVGVLLPPLPLVNRFRLVRSDVPEKEKKKVISKVTLLRSVSDPESVFYQVSGSGYVFGIRLRIQRAKMTKKPLCYEPMLGNLYISKLCTF
jgi:hypothetical protein